MKYWTDHRPFQGACSATLLSKKEEQHVIRNLCQTRRTVRRG